MAQHADEPRPLVWRGSSKSDFVRFPAAAQREVGYALFLAQMGERHPTMVKTLKGSAEEQWSRSGKLRRQRLSRDL